MRESPYKASRFCLVLAVLLSAFLALPDFLGSWDEHASGRAELLHLLFGTLHSGLRIVLVEPLGLAGAIAFAMGCGALAAWLCWPKEDVR